MSTKSVKLVTSVTLICATIALVVALSVVHFSQIQTAHASAVTADPMVLTAVDATSPSCRTHRTVTQVASSSTTTFAPCLPGTVMQTTRVPQSQARAHHWSYLPESGNTPEQIAALVQTQREALRARPAPASGTQVGSVVAPNYTGPNSTGPALSGAQIMRPAICGWNIDTGTENSLNGDTVSGDIYYYLAADCSTIILNYSTSVVVSSFNNPIYFQHTWYNFYYIPYCWGHACDWGDFEQTLAPAYHVYRHDYNANEDCCHDYSMGYTNTSRTDDPNVNWYFLDMGNLI